MRGLEKQTFDASIKIKNHLKVLLIFIISSGILKLVVKNSEKEFCSGCAQSHNCQSVYEHLGRQDGPSVAGQAFGAFLVPLLVFIAALGILEWVFACFVRSRSLQSILSFLSAALVSFVYVLIATAIRRRRDGRQRCREFKGV